MYIDVVFSPQELVSRGDISTKSVVVIDVLRATSTIAYALWGYRKNGMDDVLGCSKIIPVDSLEKAEKKSWEFDRNEVLLAGERFCLKPEGFDLGNSPSEYTIDRVKDKIIIFSTTNGTKALTLSEKAKFITTASFVNATACSNIVFQNQNDTIILCAGRSDKTTKEDSACAGLIVDLLIQRNNENDERFGLSDSADIALRYFNHYKHDILNLLENSEAGKNLIEVNLQKDLVDCSMIDVLSIVTEYKDGCITGRSL